jgi:hypothetical protein
MTAFSRSQLENLIRHVGTPCASVFLPTRRGVAGAAQNPVRLWNMLGEVREQLAAKGYREDTADQIIRPAVALLEDFRFRERQRSGLALFLAPEWMTTFRLPWSPPELVVVGHRFHIKPLLPLLSVGGRFFVLALSQNSVRLYEATGEEIHEVDSDDIPDSLCDAVGYDWEQRSLQFITAAPKGGGSGRHAVYHGHGAGKDDHEGEVTRFLQLVDQGVRALLGEERAPLVVAAVDWVASAYRAVSKYPALVEECITGNPDETPAQDLHRLAWQIAQPIFRAGEEEAACQVLERMGTSLASDDLGEVILAAHDGRVDTLFVARGVQRWGQFDPRRRRTVEHGPRQPDNEDLLDLAAAQTLIHGGMVYAVELDDVPSEQSPIAALLRYGLPEPTTGRHHGPTPGS